MTEMDKQLLPQIAEQIAQISIMNRHLLNMVFHKMSDRSDPLKNPFNSYGKKAFSQSDEDGLTFEIVKRLSLKEGVFVEFGVGSGLENNTMALVGAKWRGVWIGNEDLAVNTNPSNAESKSFVFIKNLVKVDNVVGLLESGLAAISKPAADLISLNLDGNDIHLAEKILESGVRPSAFIVPYNAKFAPPIEFVADYNENNQLDGSDYFGASLTTLNNLFDKYGYFLVCCNFAVGSSAFFVKSEHRNLFPEVPDDLDQLWRPPACFNPPVYGRPASVKTIEALFKALQQDGQTERPEAPAPEPQPEPQPEPEPILAPNVLRGTAPIQIPFPALFQVELTGHCNIDCSMCARSAGLTRPIKHMDIEMFKEIVDQSRYYQMPIGWLHHFGETLMYPKLREALSYFKANGFGNGAISTNAILLNEEKRDILLENSRYILCDMDSMDPVAYKNIRNNKFFKRVRDNISSLIAARDQRGIDCKIVVQFLRTTLNKDESITDMMDYFGRHENVKFIEKGTLKQPRGADLTLFSTVNQRDYRVGCYMAKRQFCIMCNGEVTGCCFDADGEQVIGDVRKEKIIDIWQGHAHRNQQARLDVGDFSQLPVCAKCSGPDTGDEARLKEQINLYVDEWKKRNAKVVIGPYSENMVQILINTRMHEIAPVIFTREQGELRVPTWAKVIHTEAIDQISPDIIFIYSPDRQFPDRSAEAYFDVRHYREKGIEVVVLGSFID